VWRAVVGVLAAMLATASLATPVRAQQARETIELFRSEIEIAPDATVTVREIIRATWCAWASTKRPLRLPH
jgi:hypothetical protein